MVKPFDGKKVFVSGGTSGINLAIAEAFAAAGATLGVLSRSGDKVAEARTGIASHGVICQGYCADVRDYPAVEASLGAFHATHGAIDVLVNGAAGNFVAPALGMSPNGFRSVVRSISSAAFTCCGRHTPSSRNPAPASSTSRPARRIPRC